MSFISRPGSTKPEPGSSSRPLTVSNGLRPSPTPSNSSTVGKQGADAKRKRTALMEQTVYSQPADTGTGHELMTQVVYATDYLKGKEKPVNFADIFNYLSIPASGDTDKIRRNLEAALKGHPKIEYLASSKTFRFRPTHNVRNADELRAYLQAQPTAQGILVRELKDGWPGAMDAIAQLEAENAILVTRNKKDQTPKMVWSNDPSLSKEVDTDFKDLFHRTRLPERSEDMRSELERAGLTPTSKVHKPVNNGLKAKEKKRRAPRSGGRITNHHMSNVLKDYSHLKK